MAGIETPVSLEIALKERDDLGLHTIAAYLISWADILTAPKEVLLYTLPEDELAALGFNSSLPIQQLDGRVPLSAVPGPSEEQAVEMARSEPSAYYDQLADLIGRAEENGTVPDILAALRYGMAAPDGLVRVSALSSGLRVFDLNTLASLVRFEWFVQRLNEISDLARDVFWTLFQNFATGLSGAQVPLTPSLSGPPQKGAKGLILVHGTHLSFSSPPTWYFPGTGDLFNYISPRRRDIYPGDDYFEWEGRWSDRGRAIAAKNFVTWVRYHDMESCDVVTHSHGGNVVMKAAEMGLRLRRVVFLSCPVHWQKYNLLHGNISEAYAARVRFDFVVLADRGAQTFPAAANLIEERQVGGWFGMHWDTRTPETWLTGNIENMLF